MSASTKGCSGDSTKNVAPNKVSGRVVNTSISPAAEAKRTRAPSLRPIQLRCINLMGSGQSRRLRSSSSRSEYAVMFIIHWRMLRLNTGKLPMSLRPSAVTSSLARMVPSPGHQFTGASVRYTKRWASTTLRCSLRESADHERPSSTLRFPVAYKSSSSAIGRALPSSLSNQELKICRNTHWVQR